MSTVDALYQQILHLHAQGRPYALGTVVHTTGSTPQKTGARAVFLPGGELLGTLGGGCMEAEARRKGMLLTRGGQPELMELHLDDDFGWDDGLICGGTAHILLQPRPEEDQVAVLREALQLRAQRGRGMLALVAAGPAAAVGRSLLVREDGSIYGELGAPELQSALREEALRRLAEPGQDDPRRILIREPEATVYLEPIVPRPVCLIAGAGHIGAALCHYAARAGFDVAIVDDRPSLCNAERLPDAAHVVAADIVETVREWPKGPETYVVIVTRGHKHDAVVLREVIHAPVAYLGMIGSKRKILTIYQEFVAQGIATPEQLARVHAPIGLDIGALTVDEIALCIAAELIQVRRKGNPHGTGHRDCPGGGRIEADGAAGAGDAEGALALRLQQRGEVGRPLVESLPRRF